MNIRGHRKDQDPLSFNLFYIGGAVFGSLQMDLLQNGSLNPQYKMSGCGVMYDLTFFYGIKLDSFVILSGFLKSC